MTNYKEIKVILINVETYDTEKIEYLYQRYKKISRETVKPTIFVNKQMAFLEYFVPVPQSNHLIRMIIIEKGKNGKEIV